jgi:hypothetical protein
MRQKGAAKALFPAPFFPKRAAIPGHAEPKAMVCEGEFDDHPDENQAPLDPVDP